jgi:hypothetical protein
MEDYTQEQHRLDVMVRQVGPNTRPRDVFKVAHSVAEVMRQHCDWTITASEADDVAKEVTHRFGI